MYKISKDLCSLTSIILFISFIFFGTLANATKLACIAYQNNPQPNCASLVQNCTAMIGKTGSNRASISLEKAVCPWLKEHCKVAFVAPSKIGFGCLDFSSCQAAILSCSDKCTHTEFRPGIPPIRTACHNLCKKSYIVKACNIIPLPSKTKSQ